jgi:hypothetical protein
MSINAANYLGLNATLLKRIIEKEFIVMMQNFHFFLDISDIVVIESSL